MLLFRISATLILLGGLAACSENSSQRTTSSAAGAPLDTAAVRKAAQEYRVHYNTPVSLDSTDFYYQPISVVPLDQASRSRFLSSNEYGEYEADDRSSIEGTCYNVLFFQKSTLQEHALFEHGRFVVTAIDTDSKPDVRWPYLFYTVIKADTNADSEQNEKDASALFVSDRSGRQLRQLTPNGTRLANRIILSKTNILLVEVQPDSNGNRAFTHADGTYWLRFDLANLSVPPTRQPTPALSGALHQQMLERQSRSAQ
ncbi:hypothetical protein J0X19_18780 [Hymenobacter sp. BT186]|uniref:Lipoprotein n=1 Tax=Hymenobacter telluris TaxID=2816474 RepID=A0A939JEJ1_9BACT|nr:hypothetical protein [Hymenobacter telluris]MBO0360013.1 hypothetical protein [Hymenobacter telluris]MBW3376040.1 hypothetical protein [Hymenobacter norwichensis]